MTPALKIPNLVRNVRGEVDWDFGVRQSIAAFQPHRRRYSSNGGFNLDVFLSTYSHSDAQYRHNFLAEWLNPDIRSYLDRLRVAIPGRTITEIVMNDLFDELDSDRNQDRIIAEISLVKRMIYLPEALEEAAQMPGNSDAVKALRRFADKTRRSLDYFVRIVHPFKKGEKSFEKAEEDSEELEDLVNWANNVLKRIQYTEPFFEELKELKSQLKHYKDLSAPYLFEINGKRIPSCKPVLLDPERFEGRIDNAYNPLYFKRKEVGRTVEILGLNVPNDVVWCNQARGTYIHGPNGQGKTVYSETVALNIHLAMNGAFCFADNAELSLPGRLFPCFDLGSSVGKGHFGNGGESIKYLLRKIQREDIVFMDEVGSGTEPDAEREIAKGLSDSLLDHDITFFAVTHDKGSWIHNNNREDVRVLRSASYKDKAREFKVWEGVAPDGYGLEKARGMGIDPVSIKRALNKRLGRVKKFR